MKKLALISPKNVLLNSDSDTTSFFRTSYDPVKETAIDPMKFIYWSGASLGLLIVAALTPSYFSIDFIDENYEQIKFDANYDLVGISAMTQQAVRAYEIADEFRKRGTTVVIGGIHATVMSEEAKEHADAVIVGEAETLWPHLINDFIKGRLKPYYRSMEPIDLAQSPLPRYELLKKYDYRMFWIQTTRGCPRDCEFCAASKVYGKNYRYKNIEQVIVEINFIKRLWKEPLINFADDNMFVNKAYSRELIKKLKEAGIRWAAQTDVSIAEDDGLLRLLRESGCTLLFIGFETLSVKNQLDNHGFKQNRIKKYPEIIQKIQSYGIGVLGAFIIGLDEDDMSIVDDISSFIIDNRLYASHISILTPLPGTRLRERLLKENRILSNDWSRYALTNVNFIPKKMTPKELEQCLLKIYKRVYNKDVRSSVVRHFMGIYADLQNKKRCLKMDASDQQV